MVIEVVDNHGVTNMSAELTRRLNNCTTARLATASLTKDGLTAIENALSLKRKRRLNVKLLVGLYNGHTEAAALRKLLTLQTRRKGSLQVKVAKNFRFHWKVYLFSTEQRLAAYVGSSNLTGDGLAAEGEFNLRLSGAMGDRALRNIAETFDRTWRKDSVPLTAMISDNFAPISQRSRQLSKQIHPKLRKLLRHVRRPEPNVRLRVPDHTSVFSYVKKSVKGSTNKEVSDKTSWDAKRWEWLVYRARPERDRVLNAGSFYLAEIHRAGGWISLNDVCDEDEFGTEDGRFFIAYRKRKGSVAKAINKRTLKQLRDGGLITRKAGLCRARRLGSAHQALLNKLLKVPA
jgi:HKD family nuclease